MIYLAFMLFVSFVLMYVYKEVTRHVRYVMIDCLDELKIT